MEQIANPFRQGLEVDDTQKAVLSLRGEGIGAKERLSCYGCVRGASTVGATSSHAQSQRSAEEGQIMGMPAQQNGRIRA